MSIRWECIQTWNARLLQLEYCDPCQTRACQTERQMPCHYAGTMIDILQCHSDPTEYSLRTNAVHIVPHGSHVGGALLPSSHSSLSPISTCLQY